MLTNNIKEISNYLFTLINNFEVLKQCQFNSYEKYQMIQNDTKSLYNALLLNI